METDEGRRVAMLFAGVVWLLALGLGGFDRIDAAGLGDTQRAVRRSRTRAQRASLSRRAEGHQAEENIEAGNNG